MKLTTFLALGVWMALAFAVGAIGRSEYHSAGSLGFCAWFLFIGWLGAKERVEVGRDK